MSRENPIHVEYKTLVVLWFALLTSQILFLVLVYFMKPELFTFDSSRSLLNDQPLITLAFGGIALVFLILSFVLSRQHMRRAVQDKDAGCVQTGLVLGCALSEIPSILGLILAFAFSHPYFYLWIILGAVGILLHFPRKHYLDAAMQ
jgi:FtsH-binding integral membrane protein